MMLYLIFNNITRLHWVFTMSTWFMKQVYKYVVALKLVCSSTWWLLSYWLSNRSIKTQDVEKHTSLCVIYVDEVLELASEEKLLAQGTCQLLSLCSVETSTSRIVPNNNRIGIQESQNSSYFSVLHINTSRQNKWQISECKKQTNAISELFRYGTIIDYQIQIGFYTTVIFWACYTCRKGRIY